MTRLARRLAAVAALVALGASISAAGVVDVVVRERNGNALEDQGLTLHRSQQLDSYLGFQGHAITDGQGKATFEKVEPGTYGVHFDPPRDPALLRPEDNPWATVPVLTVSASNSAVAIEVEFWRGVPALLDIVSRDVELPAGKVVLLHTETGRTIEHGFMRGDGYEAHLQQTLVEGRWQAQLVIPAGYLQLDIRVNGESIPGGVAEVDTSLDAKRASLEWDLSAPCVVNGYLLPERFGATVVATLLEPGDWLAQETLRGRSHQRVEPQRWDPGSEFFLRLPPGKWVIAPEGERLESSEPPSVEVTLAAGSYNRQDFALEAKDENEYVLTIVVVEPDGNSGVSGAVVALYRPGRVGSEPPVASAVTERKWARGEARFEDLEPGSYEVVAGHADWLDGRARVTFAPTKKKPHARETVVLAAGGTIHAVALAENGSPLTDVELVVEWIGGDYPSPLVDDKLADARLHRHARTDLTGFAVVHGLAEGPWRVEGRAVGERALERFVRVAQGKMTAREHLDLDVVPPARHDVRLEVLPAASITGRLVCDDRGPMPPAIAARAYDEAASWGGIERGPESEGAVLWTVSTEPGVEPGPVIDVERMPLTGRDLDRFKIGPLEPGSYVLASRFEGYEGWAWGYGTDLRAEAASLRLEAGQALDLGSFEGRCAPAIVVRPRLLSGEPVPDLRLGRYTIEAEARRDSGDKLTIVPAVEAQRGHLVIRGLVPAQVSVKLGFEHPYLVPRSAEWAASGLEIDRGTERVEHIVFERAGGALVVDSSAPAVRVRTLDLPARVEPTRAARASFEGLVPGDYEVAACLDAACASTTHVLHVQVEPYRTHHVELDGPAAPD